MSRRFVVVALLCSTCSEPLGDRCGPDLPPCPSGFSCVDALCRPQADAGSAGGAAAGGSAGGSPSGGQAGGQISGGAAGGSTSGGVAGGTAGGAIGGGSTSGGGATAGGGTVGGGSTAGGSTTCSPGCAPYEECVGATCTARYSAIAVTAPARTSQPITVLARLISIPGRSESPPQQLELDATLSGGGTPVRATGVLSRLTDGGFASASPLAVSRDGTWAINVFWADAGPSGTGAAQVDTSGPLLTAVVPMAPVPSAFPDGLDFRDPLDAPGARTWKRHDSFLVRVESSSSDIDPATVVVAVNGFQSPASYGCGADGGATDGGIVDGGIDAGFCGYALVELPAIRIPGLRASLNLVVTASDDLGNRSTIDGGTVSVTRWAFSFDGGGIGNGFSVSGGGIIAAPDSTALSVAVLDPGGTRIQTISTHYKPVRNVGMSARGSMIHVLEWALPNLFSRGESFEVVTGQKLGDWLTSASRVGLHFSGPLMLSASDEDSVCAMHKYGASSALVSSSDRVQQRWSSVSQTGSNTPLLASASNSRVLSTNGMTIDDYNTPTSARNFYEIEGVGQASLPGGVSEVLQLLALNGTQGFVGLATVSGVKRGFLATSSSSFTLWPAQFPEAVGDAVYGNGRLYFVRKYGSFSVPCVLTSTATSVTCASPNLQDQISGIALGERNTVYTVASRAPTGSGFIQVRSSSTLAVVDEIALPGMAPGECTALTPTCIGGRPLIGCIDSAGRIGFVYTDGRGADARADWPMEGHDPGRSQNSATDLSPYTCP